MKALDDGGVDTFALEQVNGGGEVSLFGQTMLGGHVFDQQFAELAQFNEAGIEPGA